MYFKGKNSTSKAFALPTVLIASVVLLTVLAVSVTATAAVRTTLKNQYYVQLAQIAGESGVAFAKACLAANGNVPLWTDAKPLTPATDCAGNYPASPLTVSALVVAGGGSGGTASAGHGGSGGGGAGGLLYNGSYGFSLNTPIAVTVGAGGAGVAAATTNGNNGAASSFGSMSTVGGGGGGRGNDVNGTAGNAGGSGGGGGYRGGNLANGSAGTAGQGYAGGTNSSGNNGGGGGGAGGVGQNGAALGIGGVGYVSAITGTSVTYATGGTGSSFNTGYVPAAGAANTGNGGGGGNYGGINSGAGGSGVVIISFPASSNFVVSATLTPSGTPVAATTAGNNRVYTFTSNGSFNVTSVGSVVCPSNPKCSVAINGNVRSSFSVPRPTVDAVTGQALTIPNSGYVEITRTSFPYAVWRTYKQPSVQAAVVPDLCSGNATAARGWNAAVRVAAQDPLPSASTAQTISIADAAINPGVVYYRKDFNVSAAGTYDLNVYTSSAQDSAVTYIDGVPVLTAAGSVATTKTTLQPGCHVIVTKLTNQAYLPRASDFTASLTRQGAATPLVVSDASWRVTAGDAVHFATNNYFEAPTAWEQVLDFGIWNNTALSPAGNPTNWATVSGDSLAEYISTKVGNGGISRPGLSYAWFRDPKPFVTTTATTVRITHYCDDGCTIYLDGVAVASGLSQGIVSKSITIQPGTHTFGVRLYNGAGASGNPSMFIFAAVDLTTNQVLARTSPNWNTTTSWSTTAAEPYSYDGSYAPVPAVQATTNAKVLVVGGGGGGGSDMGGGGGGGGVIYDAAYPIAAGTYPVTVGVGGNGALAGISQARGVNGGNSTFGTIRSLGGGGGGSEYSNNGSPPGSGASAGGSAGGTQTLRASGVIGMGFDSAVTIGNYYPTGGGGAGGPGAINPATGGVGVSNDILGTAYFFGGGGGGSGYTGIGGNGGNGGGGGGAVGTTTGGSGLNAGSAGGGGVINAQTNRPGGNAGANTGGGGGGGSHYNSNNTGGRGGSGIVVISYPTGSLVASGGTVTTSGGWTIHTFTTSGTFVVGGYTVEALVVAGGGGGGGNCNSCGGAGGGGAGGVLYTDSYPIAGLGSIGVTVGAGGAGGAGINSVAGNAANGSSSIFGSLTAVGGGGGRAQNATAGGVGGSGGGGSGGSSPAPGAGGAGTTGQGNAGFSGWGAVNDGGGGGGAGSAGSNNIGGAGLSFTISGASVTYGGGGGGGAYSTYSPGTGGSGGGGNGANQSINNGNGYPGTANTGGGGGGANGVNRGGTGGLGGSGIVIISYPTGKITATGGTITTANGRTIHTFLTDGEFIVTSLN